MKFPYNQVLQIQTDYKSSKLTREQATEQLSFLLDFDNSNDFCPDAADKPSEYFKPASYGPLLRLSDVCNVLRVWAETFSTPMPTDDKYKTMTRAEFKEPWYRVDLAISKSNFLARLFFTDEGVRTQPCPTHKGQWSGCFVGDHSGGTGPCLCQSGGNVTGWLAENPVNCDRTYWDEEKKRYRMRDEQNPKSPRIG